MVLHMLICEPPFNLLNETFEKWSQKQDHIGVTHHLAEGQQHPPIHQLLHRSSILILIQNQNIWLFLLTIGCIVIYCC